MDSSLSSAMFSDIAPSSPCKIFSVALVADLEGARAMPPKRIMVSASDVAVDKRLYVSRQSESVIKSAYVLVTDRTVHWIALLGR